jgi:putative ABC transport system permease protein
MLSNYLKVALRLIRRQKGYALINMAGLAIGMAAFVLIALWVVDELSYDRFHEHSSRIQRVCVDYEAGSHMTLPLSMPALAGVVVNGYPEVINAARISRPVRASVKFLDREFYENLVCYADGSLFDVFTFPFISGDPKTALEAPYSVVITKDISQKYFGLQNPLGKQIRIDGAPDYVVTGVVENVPVNSHFRFQLVRSFETLYSENRRDMENWLNIQYYTYLLLAEGADAGMVEQRFPSTVEKYLGPTLQVIGGTLELFLQPLTRIHLFSELSGDIAVQGDITYVYLFSGIAIFILLLACINFINLSTARSSERAKEIGMRKTLGSTRRLILLQFLGESTLVSLFSFLLAGVMIESIEPLFESLIGRQLSVSMSQTPVLFVGFAGLAVLVGVLAGIYPALHLSSFLPVRAIRGGISGRTRASRFRNVLVVLQFTISIFLIICTIAVYQQIRFMKSKSPGYDKDNILVIPQVRSTLERNSFPTIRTELMAIPGVLDAAGSALVPTQGVQHGIFYPEGFTWEQPQKLTRLDVEPNYIPAMNIEIVAGRNFSEAFPTDPAEALLINETVARMFGWTEPLGKTFSFFPPGGSEEAPMLRRVVGVVRDFHFTSLHHRIDPVVILYDTTKIRYLTLRLAPEHVERTIGLIKNKWGDLEPERPFDYFFLGDVLSRQYWTEERVGILSLNFSLLAVFIGCLGLFGLASFMAKRRTKEIAIRKVLGASANGIFRFMSMDFLLLVLVSNLLAWPAAYLGLRLWLQNFPYRIGIAWWVMLTAGSLALVTALITVSFQAIRAARANPVNSLRYE